MVNNIEEAKKCDILLSKLINDEKKYNSNINIARTIDYYSNIYTKDDNYLFVAIEEDIVGYIYLKIIKGSDVCEDKDTAIIDALYVEEEYRNKKIATNLIKEAIDFLKIKQIDYVTISVISNNEVAKKLYQKLGFNEYSISLKYDLN